MLKLKSRQNVLVKSDVTIFVVALVVVDEEVDSVPIVVDKFEFDVVPLLSVEVFPKAKSVDETVVDDSVFAFAVVVETVTIVEGVIAGPSKK